MLRHYVLALKMLPDMGIECSSISDAERLSLLRRFPSDCDVPLVYVVDNQEVLCMMGVSG